MLKVTSRCVNRSYRLVPTPEVVEVVEFCLAYVSEKCREQGKLELYAFCFMSTHYHLTLRDIGGCVSEFLKELNSLLSRNLNAIRGTSGTNFEADPGIQTILGADRVLESMAYDEANPVTAGIVVKSDDWTGVTSASMVIGEEREIERPNAGIWSTKRRHASRPASMRSGRAAYAGRSKLPKVVTLRLDRPPLYPELDDAQLGVRVATVRKACEAKAAAERKDRRVLGMKRARKIHWNTLATPEEMFGRRPTFAAHEPLTRRMLGRLRRAFLNGYAAALAAFKAGEQVVAFPEGTVMMRHRFGVRVVPYGL